MSFVDTLWIYVTHYKWMIAAVAGVIGIFAAYKYWPKASEQQHKRPRIPRDQDDSQQSGRQQQRRRRRPGSSYRKSGGSRKSGASRQSQSDSAEE